MSRNSTISLYLEGIAVSLIVLGIVLGGCDRITWVDTSKETKLEKQVAGRDNEGLKVRVDDLDHRVQDAATAVDKRMAELEQRIRQLERPGLELRVRALEQQRRR